MKILAIGDPHGDLEKIKKIPLEGIELILITGDVGKADLARKRHFENVERKKQGLPELEEDAEFERQVFLQIHNSTLDISRHFPRSIPVYMLEGNVGIYSDSETKKKNKKYGFRLVSTTKEIEKLGNVYLPKNRLRVLNGLRIGFLEYFVDTCWVKEFRPGDYEKSMAKAQKQTTKAQRVLNRFGSVDILVCHQPPYGYLDKVDFPGVPAGWKGKHAGSKAILDYIKKYQPRYVFCGHIHEGEGMAKIGNTEVYNLGVGGHKIIEL
ncbi:MAG: metallophosphoesterase [Nanoarchaeota archaeon]|nr:metallophosphoesterase [Nanoarchaeota archaeon]